MRMVNDQKITPLHLLCESSLCSRESIIKVKDIINDPNCLNAENSAGKTPYASVRYFSQKLFSTGKFIVELTFSFKALADIIRPKKRLAPKEC